MIEKNHHYNSQYSSLFVGRVLHSDPYHFQLVSYEDLNHLHINCGVPALLRSAHVHALHGEVVQHVHAVHGEVVQHVEVVLVHQVQAVIAHQGGLLVNVCHD